MRAPDATRSANFAASMGFALVMAVGWGLNWPVPKYRLTELSLLSTLKQGTIDACALSSPTSDVAVRDLGAAYLIDIQRRRHHSSMTSFTSQSQLQIGLSTNAGRNSPHTIVA
jgi:hypothetical protein